MNTVNLFPYRQRQRRQRARAFQWACGGTALSSVLLAVAAIGAIDHARRGPQAPEPAVRNPVAAVLSPASWTQMEADLRATVSLQNNRLQHYRALHLMRAILHPLPPGLWLQRVAWGDQRLEVDVWATSPQEIPAWIEQWQPHDVEARTETVASPPAPLAEALSMQVVRLKVQWRDADAPR